MASTAEPVVAGIAYKIKVKPDDFRVEEICTLPLQAQGSFGVYRLEKTGWNTVDALQRIARQNGIPYAQFSYGGRKDRHARTTQWFTVRSDRVLKSDDAAWKISPLGRSAEPMAPEYIAGNRFEIVLRNVPPWQEGIVSENLAEVLDCGLPNYFDDQRFGSVDSERGFLAAHLLRGNAEMAARIALTLRYSGEKTAAKRRKYAIDQRWGDWPACAELAQTNFEKRAFASVRRNGNDWLAVLNLMPREELNMALTALQSQLWNLAASRLIQRRCSNSFLVAGKAGPYRLYRRISPEERQALETMRLPAPGPSMGAIQSEAAAALEEALAEMGLQGTSLQPRGLKDVFLKAHERLLLLDPADLKLAEAADDELYKKKRKLLLQFQLPRGSFGTMVVKRLTALRHAPGDKRQSNRSDQSDAPD